MFETVYRIATVDCNLTEKNWRKHQLQHISSGGSTIQFYEGKAKGGDGKLEGRLFFGGGEAGGGHLSVYPPLNIGKQGQMTNTDDDCI